MNVYSTTCRPRSRHFRKRNMFETRYLFIRSNGQIVGHGSGEQTSALVCSTSRVFTFETYTSLRSDDVKFISNPRKNRCTEKIVKRKKGKKKRNDIPGEKSWFLSAWKADKRSKKTTTSEERARSVHNQIISRGGVKVDDKYYRRQFSFSFHSKLIKRLASRKEKLKWWNRFTGLIERNHRFSHRPSCQRRK